MPTRIKNKKKNETNPPVFSHDFIILNHGDIFATILLLVFASSISQNETIKPISKLSSSLLFLNNEVSEDRDFFEKSSFDYIQAIFYVVVFIVIHCIYQEYFIDKVLKKLRNSNQNKKQSANESFLMFLWHFINSWSVLSIINSIGFGDIFNLSDYPHKQQFPYSVKFFFILQIAHWLHTLPELYLSKATKDQYKPTER